MSASTKKALFSLVLAVFAIVAAGSIAIAAFAAIREAPLGPTVQYPAMLGIQGPAKVTIGSIAAYTYVVTNISKKTQTKLYLNVPPITLNSSSRPFHADAQNGGYSTNLPGLKPGKSVKIKITIVVPQPQKGGPDPGPFPFSGAVGVLGSEPQLLSSVFSPPTS